MVRVSALVLSIALFAIAAAAQEQPRPPMTRPDPAEQIKAMGKLDFLIGNWEGEGWMDFGGTRANFHGTEVVQRKLNGVTLLVEGSFFAKRESGEPFPVHTTLGVISFDPQQKNYRFQSWLAQGTSGERELTVLDRGFQWEMRNPRGVVRYTTTISEKGEWVEIGERSADGTNWQKFFEMTLRKKS